MSTKGRSRTRNQVEEPQENIIDSTTDRPNRLINEEREEQKIVITPEKEKKSNKRKQSTKLEKNQISKNDLVENEVIAPPTAKRGRGKPSGHIETSNIVGKQTRPKRDATRNAIVNQSESSPQLLEKLDVKKIDAKKEPLKRGRGSKKTDTTPTIADESETNTKKDITLKKTSSLTLARPGASSTNGWVMPAVISEKDTDTERNTIAKTRKGTNAKVKPNVTEQPKRGKANILMGNELEESDASSSSSTPSQPLVKKRGRKAASTVAKTDEPTDEEVKGHMRRTTRDRKKAGVAENGVEEEIKSESISSYTKPQMNRRKRFAELERIEEVSEDSIKLSPKISKKQTTKGKKAAVATTSYDKIDFNLDKDKEFNLKISSWNVAGLRAWVAKGETEYIKHEKPDILCLQEIKCTPEQIPDEVCFPGYHPYWLCKPGGHAGVAIYSKIMPINIEYGIGDAEQDSNGRLLTAEYEKFYLLCVYVPNSGRKLVTLSKRLRWNKLFEEYVQKLDAIKPVIICGDMNVSHNEIDLANPKSNRRNAGFTQEERDGMTNLLSLGYVDTFRKLYPEKENAYTFWTYMNNARAKNVGWRLDYFIVSEKIMPKISDNVIRSEVFGSDHCPITLFLNI